MRSSRATSAPSSLNRIDEIVVFRPLEKSQVSCRCLSLYSTLTLHSAV